MIQIDINLKSGKKLYFASDFHLGVPAPNESRERERKIVSWLDEIMPDAQAVFLLGDLFDFWFEYKNAVPKGYVRLLGKLAELTEKGIDLHIFTGNHDIWMFGYLEEEVGATIHKKPLRLNTANSSFYLAHGDGLGPGDHGFKFLKKIFTNRLCQHLFASIHPSIGIGIANFFSKKSRLSNGPESFLGDEKEALIIHSNQLSVELNGDIDYYIYGHRHFPIMRPLKEKGTYVNLGDWISHFTFAVFNGNDLKLENYRQK